MQYIKTINVLQSTQYGNFRISVLFSLIIAFGAALFLLAFGKVHSFLLINSYYNPELDFIFTYITWLGNGIIYIPVLLYCLLLNRQFTFPFLLAITLCALFTHFLKRIVYPNELRPLSLEAHKIFIHKVMGVYINRLHSFPSGHTGTAFSLAILLSTVVKQKAWVFVLITTAFLVGYSRVYLAQHFVIDVLMGMLVGIITAYLSILLHIAFLKKHKNIQVLQGASSNVSSFGDVTASHIH